MIFPKVRGQKRAVSILGGLLETGRMPSAILFAGLEGVGKTLLAFEFAKALLCDTRRAGDPPCGVCGACESIDRRCHPDVAVIDAAYQACLDEEDPAKQKTLRVDTLRHARRDMEMRSLLGGWKVAIVQDAHTMEPASANALLKILEEPQERALWILITSQRERLPKTIPSRCFSVPFSPLPASAVREILAGSGVELGRAAALAELCEGSASRALELSEAGFPEALSGGPLAPIAAADALPKELYLQRVKVELALFSLAQDVRLRRLRGEVAFARAQRPLRELGSLRQALRSNADPKTVLTLACLEARDAGGVA